MHNASLKNLWARAWRWLSMDGRLRPAQPLALLLGPLALALALVAPYQGLFVLAYGWLLMRLGYQTGKSAVSKLLETGWVNRIIKGASMLGLFMIGGLAASYIDFQLSGTFMNAGVETTFQSVLDGIIPGIIPLCVIFAVRAYYKKNRGKSTMFAKVILVILACCCLLALIGLI